MSEYVRFKSTGNSPDKDTEEDEEEDEEDGGADVDDGDVSIFTSLAARELCSKGRGDINADRGDTDVDSAKEEEAMTKVGGEGEEGSGIPSAGPTRVGIVSMPICESDDDMAVVIDVAAAGVGVVNGAVDVVDVVDGAWVAGPGLVIVAGNST